MKTTFERAMGDIRLLNANKARTRCDASTFFAHATEVVCHRDGKRCSDVITYGDHQGVVLQVNVQGQQRVRMLALWDNGRGRVVRNEKSMPRPFRAHLERANACGAMPTGVATFISEALEDALLALPVRTAPVAVPAASVKMVRGGGEVFSGAFPVSDIELPNPNLQMVMKQLLPNLQQRHDYLLQMELAAAQVAQRQPAYSNASEALLLMHRGEFPATRCT